MVSACLQLNYHNWKNRKTVTAPRHNYMSDSQLPENATNNPGSKALLNEFTQLNEGIQHVQKIVDTIKDSTQISYSGQELQQFSGMHISLLKCKPCKQMPN